MKATPLPPDRVRALTGTPATPEPVKHEVGCAPGSRKQWFRPKIPVEIIDKICQERAAGVPVLTVAAKYGVSGACVSLVYSGQRRSRRIPPGK